jgi:uncharacterized protein YxjI
VVADHGGDRCSGDERGGPRTPPRGPPAGTRYLLREKLLAFGDDCWIENERGERIFPRPVHGRAGGRGKLDVEGDILDHEYQITRDGIPVANISKRWFRVR